MHSELIIQVKCMRELTYLKRDQPATTYQFFFLFFFYFIIFFYFFLNHAIIGQKIYPTMEHHVYDMAQIPMAF
jgi:hypothetical protein